MRYDGMPSPLREEQKPVANLVKLNELRKHLPTDEPRVSTEQRAETISERRRHVQLRYGL